jgi:hypothetical protein
VNAGIFRRARCGGLRPAALRGLAFVIATFWHDLAEADPTPYTDDMPIDRDDHDERLARIEQMLEDLRREVRRFSEFHQQVVEDARLAREHTQNTRAELRSAVSSSRSKRPRRKSKPTS